MPDDAAAAILAALRRLPVPEPGPPAPFGTSAEDRESLLLAAVPKYVNMMENQARMPKTPRRFVYVGQKAARRALEKASKLLAAAADEIEELPAEAVGALANLPPGEALLQPWTIAPRLRADADRFRRADPSTVPQPPARQSISNRPREHYAHAVAANAAADFAVLTGTAPTIVTLKQGRMSGASGGPFVDFVGALFEALSVPASAANAARRAVAELAKEAPRGGS